MCTFGLSGCRVKPPSGPTLRAPTLRGRTDCETTKTLILAKNGLAKHGLAQNGLAKNGQIRIAKNCLSPYFTQLITCCTPFQNFRQCDSHCIPEWSLQEN